MAWELKAELAEFAYPEGMLTACLPEVPQLPTSASQSGAASSVTSIREDGEGSDEAPPPSLDNMMASSDTLDVQ